MPYAVKNIHPYRPCVVTVKGDEERVQSGLALTPAQVAEMTAAGVPISNPLAMQFFDGYRTLDFDPGLLNRRGTDINDVWEHQMSARKKLKEAADKHSSQPQKGGE